MGSPGEVYTGLLCTIPVTFLRHCFQTEKIYIFSVDDYHGNTVVCKLLVWVKGRQRRWWKIGGGRGCVGG